MQQLRRLRYCPATVEAKAKAIQAKVHAGAMYGIEAVEVPPAKVAKLTAAVIDAFRSRNNNHNADRFFATLTDARNELDPVAQLLIGRALHVRRTSCKRKGATERFKATLMKYCHQT